MTRTKKPVQPATAHRPFSDVSALRKLLVEASSQPKEGLVQGIIGYFTQCDLKSLSNEISVDDLVTFWQCILYAIWLADGVPATRDVCVEINLFVTRVIQEYREAPAIISKFLSTLFVTLQNMWESLDVYRVKKYLVFLRIFTAEICSCLARSNWDLQIAKSISTALFLSATHSKKPGVYLDDREIKCLGEFPMTLDRIKKIGAGCTVHMHIVHCWMEELRTYYTANSQTLDLDSGQQFEGFRISLVYFIQLLDDNGSDHRLRNAVLKDIIAVLKNKALLEMWVSNKSIVLLSNLLPCNDICRNSC